jgi:peptidoglycan L-alanyl-D-glutamate endopeptidase CwlK
MLTDVQEKKNREILAALIPELRSLARKHLDLCMEAGIDLMVVQGYRTLQEQAALYETGRGQDGGEKVTNARPGSSWHNFRRAYDVAVVEGGKINWNSPGYTEAGKIGKSLGLLWGGDFKSVRGDLGHFEYHPGLTLAQARTETAA